MKRQRAPLEVFNIAFLDIISCAFGAVVLIVLLSRNNIEGEFSDIAQISEIREAIQQTQQQISTLEESISGKKNQQQQLQQQITSNNQNSRSLESRIAAAKNKTQQLESNADGLKKMIESRQRAATQEGSAKEPSEEVGGIPVDSEYVIFIIDTSGSMRRIWDEVLNTMDNILDNHPRVKGVQVMSDMGNYLVSSSAGKWRKDTPRSRKSILSALRTWRGQSNSSPVEGLSIALKTYTKKTDSLSIYILGDDYTGNTYDPVIRTLNQLNTNPKTGRRIARVHAIGFRSGPSNGKFATLMREVTRQNRGTFLALP